MTKDECFIMFYKLNIAGNGLISYDEFCDCFTPRSHEYQVLLKSRGGFYGSEPDLKKYFEGATRDLLKTFIKGFVDCEVAIELVRQRVADKIKLSNQNAFAAIDEFQRGVLTIDDIRNFMKKTNLYPVEKNLALLFERFDKDGDRYIKFDEFVQGLTPFNSSDL